MIPTNSHLSLLNTRIHNGGWTAFEMWSFVSALLFALTLTGLIASDVYLFSPLPQIDKSEAIATLEDSTNDVKRRSSSVPLWQELAGEKQLYQRDQLFTGSGSTAQIYLPHLDARIRLGENSLIVIEKDQNEKSEDWLSGVFGRKDASLKKDLAFKINGSDATLKEGSVIEVKKKKDGTSSLAVLKGEVSLIDESGAESKVVENQLSLVNESGSIEKITQIPFVLLYPKDKSMLKSQQQQRVSFSWTNQIRSHELYLEVAESFDFRESKVVNVSAEDRHALTLADGHYFWRLKNSESQDESTLYSSVNSFEVVTMRPPEILSPLMGESILARGGDVDAEFVAVPLAWEAPRLSEEFLVEVSVSKDFIENTISQIVVGRQLFAKLKAEDTQYYWRVRRNQDTALGTEWSRVHTFDLKMLKESVMVTGLVAQPQSLIVGDGVQLKWDEIPSGKGFKVELASSRDFSDAGSVKVFSTKGNEFNWKVQESGHFFWRVKLAGKTYSEEDIMQLRVSEFEVYEHPDIIDVPNIAVPQLAVSDSVSVIDEIPEVEIIEGASEEKIAVSSPPLLSAARTNSGQPFARKIIHYGWYEKELIQLNSVDGAKYYEFELRSMDGRSTFTKELNPSLEIKPDSGRTEIYTRTYNEQNIPGDWNKVADFEVINGESVLSAVSPTNGQDLSIERDVHGVEVRLKWKALRNESLYQVELSRDSKFSKLEKSIEARSGSVDITLDSEGTYYWRVRGIPNPQYAYYSSVNSFRVNKTSKSEERESEISKSWNVALSIGGGLFTLEKGGKHNNYETQEFSTDARLDVGFQKRNWLGVGADLSVKEYTLFTNESAESENQNTKVVQELDYTLAYRARWFHRDRLNSFFRVGIGHRNFSNPMTYDFQTLDVEKVDLEVVSFKLDGDLGFSEAGTMQLSLGLEPGMFGDHDQISNYRRVKIESSFMFSQWGLYGVTWGPALTWSAANLELRESIHQNETDADLSREEFILWLSGSAAF